MNHQHNKAQNSFAPTLEALLEHKEWLRRLARGLVFDDSQADDVVQQVFLAALKYRPSADRDMRPWLKVVATAVAKKIGRSEVRRTRREKTAAREDVVPIEERIAQFETVDTHRQLGEFLKGLEEPYRAILLMHYFEGIPIDEVGKKLGFSRSTVRNRFKRGIELLRARLDSRYGDRTAWGLMLLPWVAPSEPGAGASRVAKKGFLGAAAAIFFAAGGALLTMSLAATSVGSQEPGGMENRVFVQSNVEESAGSSRTPVVETWENSPNQIDGRGAIAIAAKEPEDPRVLPSSFGKKATNFTTGNSVPAKLVNPEDLSADAKADTSSVEPGEGPMPKPSPVKPPKTYKFRGSINKSN